MSDLVSYAMQRACVIFGGSDGMFSNACFSRALSKIIGLKGVIDGKIVEAILWSRPDVIRLNGGSYYRRRKT